MTILVKRFILVVLSLLGLSKTHKLLSHDFQDFSFCSIVSPIATYNYTLVKFPLNSKAWYPLGGFNAMKMLKRISLALLTQVET